jgi:hypothetical protein
MASGHAIKIHAELARLARRHNVTWPQPALPLPPLAECADYSVYLHGCAADFGIDLARIRFAPRSLLWDANHLPELRYRHLPGEIGRVLELRERPDGVHAIVSTCDKRAMVCGGFSVGVTIREWQIAEEHNSNFHAVITSACIDEVSTVHAPCNPRCLVRSRTPGCAHTQLYDTATRALALIGRLVQLQLQSQTLTQGSPHV